MRTVQATRYVTPLREGGSLPAIVEADDDGLYVVKFRGAGQGVKALIAELLGGEIARTLGLPVPELVFVEVDAALGRSEADSEIQALVLGSVGRNVGLDFLPGALPFDSLVYRPDGDLASAIVWLDALITNVDRTARNTNMLLWHQQLWLVDHGATLYFQHNWGNYAQRSQDRFPAIRDHVLLRFADALPAADARLSERLTAAQIERIVALVPDDWLGDEPQFASAAEHRAAFVAYLCQRVAAPRPFLEEALDARARLL